MTFWFHISPAFFTNQGTLQASNGGSLVVVGLTGNLGLASVTGAGSSLSVDGTYTVDQPLSATDSSILTLIGTYDFGVTISAMDSTLTLGGNWTNNGTIETTNSTLNLAGTFTLPSATPFSRTDKYHILA